MVTIVVITGSVVAVVKSVVSVSIGIVVSAVVFGTEMVMVNL